MMFKMGGTLVLHDSFAFPNVAIDKIIREKVTGFPIVPTISAILLQMDLSKYQVPKPALHQQHRGGIACRAHPQTARLVPSREAFLDVWADRVQARLLLAARPARYSPDVGRPRHAE